jgi:hypothetical protein
MNKLFFLLVCLLGSCTQIIYPKADQFNGMAYVTSYTDSNAPQCIRQSVRIEHKFIELGARASLQVLTPFDTLNIDLVRLSGQTYQGTADNKPYEVTFPSRREERNGTILLIREETQTRVIASKCFD